MAAYAAFLLPASSCRPLSRPQVLSCVRFPHRRFLSPPHRFFHVRRRPIPAPDGITGYDATCRLGAYPFFQKQGRVFALPLASSKTRSFLILVCLGIAARALSKRSAAVSDFLIAFCRSRACPFRFGKLQAGRMGFRLRRVKGFFLRAFCCVSAQSLRRYAAQPFPLPRLRGLNSFPPAAFR